MRHRVIGCGSNGNPSYPNAPPPFSPLEGISCCCSTGEKLCNAPLLSLSWPVSRICMFKTSTTSFLSPSPKKDENRLLSPSICLLTPRPRRSTTAPSLLLVPERLGVKGDQRCFALLPALGKRLREVVVSRRFTLVLGRRTEMEDTVNVWGKPTRRNRTREQH